MNDETLFCALEAIQGRTPWKHVLDAGTGQHSLSWVSGLDTTRWTAVTRSDAWKRQLTEEFGARMRPGDRIVAGDWADPAFLHGEVFDVVLADYLLGAVDRFAPYFADRLLERLRRHTGERLYLIGLEPYPETADTPGGRIVLEIARLRDACILLAGDRCHREYPLEWVLRSLERAGFTVEDARRFPIIYGERFILGQLEVCLAKLARFTSQSLAREMRRAIESLRERALGLYEAHRGIHFGSDYVIHARPRSSVS